MAKISTGGGGGIKFPQGLDHPASGLVGRARPGETHNAPVVVKSQPVRGVTRSLPVSAPKMHQLISLGKAHGSPERDTLGEMSHHMNLNLPVALRPEANRAADLLERNRNRELAVNTRKYVAGLEAERAPTAEHFLQAIGRGAAKLGGEATHLEVGHAASDIWKSLGRSGQSMQELKEVGGHEGRQAGGGVGPGLAVIPGVSAGSGRKIGEWVGSHAGTIASEASEWPVMVPNAVFHGALAGAKALKGHPKELAELGKGVASGSVGELLQGNVSGALKRLDEAPLMSASEYVGVGALADKAVGRAATGLHLRSKTALRPDVHLYGKTTEPASTMKYGTGAVESWLMKGHDARLQAKADQGRLASGPLSKSKVFNRMYRKMDEHWAQAKSIMQQGRGRVEHEVKRPLRARGGLTGHIAGARAVPYKLMGYVTTDPKFKLKDGVSEEMRQTSAIHDRLNTPEVEARAHDKGAGDRWRAGVEHADALRRDTGLAAAPKQSSDATVRIAEIQDKLARLLAKYKVIGSYDHFRENRLKVPFVWHYKDQGARIDPNPAPGESPFLMQRIPTDAERQKFLKLKALGDEKRNPSKAQAQLARERAVAYRAKIKAPTRLSADQVAKMLKKDHGINEKHLGFVSAAPFHDARSDYWPGVSHTNSGADLAKTPAMTGQNHLDGLWDPSVQHMVDHIVGEGTKVMKAQHDLRTVEQFVNGRHDVAQEMKRYLKANGDRLSPALSKVEREKIEARIKELEGKPTYTREGTTPAATLALADAGVISRLTDGRVRYKPVNLSSRYAPADRKADLESHVLSERALDPHYVPPLHDGVLDSPTAPNFTQANHVGLMHEDAIKRQDSWEKLLGNEGFKIGNNLSAWWKRGAMALSPHRLVGLPMEIMARAWAGDAGPMSYTRGLKVDRAVKGLQGGAHDPGNILDRELSYVRAVAGTSMPKQIEGQLIRRDREATGALAKRLDKLESAKIPVASTIPTAIRKILPAYKSTTNAALEFENTVLGPKALSKAASGKAWNEIHKAMTGKAIGLTTDMTKFFEDLAHKGEWNMKTLEKVAVKSREIHGDWERMSPTGRVYMAASPFWNWQRNALKFIYYTMPLRHPIKTAVLASLVKATQAQWEAEGMGYKAGVSIPENHVQMKQQGGILLPNGHIWEGPTWYSPGAATKFQDMVREGVLVPPYVTEFVRMLEGRSSISNEKVKELQLLGGLLKSGEEPGFAIRFAFGVGSLIESFAGQPAWELPKLIKGEHDSFSELMLKQAPPRNEKGEELALPLSKNQEGSWGGPSFTEGSSGGSETPTFSEGAGKPSAQVSPGKSRQLKNIGGLQLAAYKSPLAKGKAAVKKNAIQKGGANKPVLIAPPAYQAPTQTYAAVQPSGVSSGPPVGESTAPQNPIPGNVAPTLASNVTSTGKGGYTIPKLEQLWVNAGGPPKIAKLMAEVAMAESGGPGASEANPRSYNPSGASGLWQVMMPLWSHVVHGNVMDPAVNARAAVEIYNQQGLAAWAGDPAMIRAGEPRIKLPIGGVKQAGEQVAPTMPAPSSKTTETSTVTGSKVNGTNVMLNSILRESGISPLFAESEPVVQHETTNVLSKSGGAPASLSSTGGTGQTGAVVAMANKIASHGYPYVWGGGHDGAFAPGGGFDCSGAVSAALHAAGFLKEPMVAEQFMSWGEAGKGRYITIWASSGHVFLQIGNKFWGTDGANRGGGAGWFSSADTSGFVPRHFRGS